MSTVVGVVLFTGVVLYATFAGADFGAGFWDLLAGGAERGARPRALADRSLTPVWEANHVWLIFVLVVAWTGFPRAFAAVTSTLFVPLLLAALGIVLRGAGFAFRKATRPLAARRLFGALFASSSVLVPFFLGAAVGAVASGRVPAHGAGDRLTSWPPPRSSGRCSCSPARTWPRSSWWPTPGGRATPRWSATSAPARSARRR